MNLILKSWIRYLDSFFYPRNVISFLILLSPFTLGKIPVLSFNYILYTYTCILILGSQLLNEVTDHIKLISNKVIIAVSLLVFSFFLSMMFGLDYKVISDLTDFDSSFNGVLFDISVFIPMQILLIFLIFISIRSIEDIEHYIKMFFVSGFFVNFIALAVVLSGSTGRLGGTFSDSNYLGRFEIFIIGISFLYFLFKKKDLLTNVLLIANIVISFLFLYLSFSRSAILTLGFIFALIFIFYGKSNYKYIFVIFSFTLIVLIFSVVTSVRTGPSLTGSSSIIYKILLEPSNFTRIVLNVAGFNMFMDYPIFGIGYHNFYNAYINYGYIPLEITLFFSKENSVIHSWLFSVLAEQGLVGTIPLLYIIFLIFKKLHRIIKNKRFNEYKFCSVTLYILFFVLIINGLFFPVFYPELVFSLIVGIILGFIKITDLKKV